jgi:hypothetical protein
MHVDLQFVKGVFSPSIWVNEKRGQKSMDSDLKVKVRGKTGGKAWFGGLACSGLAGYQAS